MPSLKIKRFIKASVMPALPGIILYLLMRRPNGSPEVAHEPRNVAHQRVKSRMDRRKSRTNRAKARTNGQRPGRTGGRSGATAQRRGRTPKDADAPGKGTNKRRRAAGPP